MHLSCKIVVFPLLLGKAVLGQRRAVEPLVLVLGPHLSYRSCFLCTAVVPPVANAVHSGAYTNTADSSLRHAPRSEERPARPAHTSWSASYVLSMSVPGSLSCDMLLR